MAASISAQTTKNGDIRGDDEVEDDISAAEKSLLQKIIRKGLVQTKQDLQTNIDPKSPLYSVKTFDALHLLVKLQPFLITRLIIVCN